MSASQYYIGLVPALRLTLIAACGFGHSLSIASAQAPAAVEVVVPSIVIQAGAPIAAGVLMRRQMSGAILGQASGYADYDAAIGKIARRTLLPGQPIPLQALRSAPIIASGQSVRLVYQVGGLRITGEGVAQNAAAVGEVVSVRSNHSGQVVRGRLTSSRDVVVEGEP